MSGTEGGPSRCVSATKPSLHSGYLRAYRQGEPTRQSLALGLGREQTHALPGETVAGCTARISALTAWGKTGRAAGIANQFAICGEQSRRPPA